MAMEEWWPEVGMVRTENGGGGGAVASTTCDLNGASGEE
jgi:hypothetical protein